MHFLVIDNRYGVPIYVFLEQEPSREAGRPSPRGRWVILETSTPADPGVKLPKHESGAMASIGGDPERLDRFAEFPSDAHVKAAGYSLIEPRYVGPSWETYVSVFRPEGGKRLTMAEQRSHGR